MEIAVLGKRQTVLGFGLAGVKKKIVAAEEKDGLLEQFESLAADEGIGLVIVDGSCEKIRRELARFIEEHRKPMVLEIPAGKEKIERGILETITKSATGAKSDV